MKKRFLVTKDNGNERIKEILIFNNPKRLRLIVNDLTWKILHSLSTKENYPMKIAKELDIHEQKVYYHIRKLIQAKAIVKVREEEKQGAMAKFYKACAFAFGIEFPLGDQNRKLGSPLFFNQKIEKFLCPILKNGHFDGKIIVGSPEPHGSFKTIARDGHYASYLTFFLGQLARLPDDFMIKLDVDVKAEKDEKSNLILVGGPGTNLFTQEINEYLPIRFNMATSEYGFIFGGLVSSKTKNIYTADSNGLIAKIVNPWARKQRILVFAGNKAVGTKACILAITRYWKQLLEDYKGEDNFAKVIQGFDLNGDGKVDSIEIIE